MSNGLLYIAGLISLALAALFAVPYFVDWNGYRGVFEEEATRILGRDVRVGGDVNVRLLPAPYVSFEKLRIADPTGITGEPFFRADSFTMRLSVPPLLKGIIEANEIVLEKPVLRLAFDAEGGGNWRIFCHRARLAAVRAGGRHAAVGQDHGRRHRFPRTQGHRLCRARRAERRAQGRFHRWPVRLQGHHAIQGRRPRGPHLDGRDRGRTAASASRPSCAAPPAQQRLLRSMAACST